MTFLLTQPQNPRFLDSDLLLSTESVGTRSPSSSAPGASCARKSSKDEPLFAMMPRSVSSSKSNLLPRQAVGRPYLLSIGGTHADEFVPDVVFWLGVVVPDVPFWPEIAPVGLAPPLEVDDEGYPVAALVYAVEVRLKVVLKAPDAECEPCHEPLPGLTLPLGS